MEILDLAIQDNLNPQKVSATKGGEYHSSCPGCGGKDRFIIWNIQNRYYCRRCEKTGDTIQYLRDFHNLSFLEACKKANITPNPRSEISIPTPRSFNFTKTTMPTHHWHEKASDFLRTSKENLFKNLAMVGHLQQRGFSLESIKKFHLGWNPKVSWEYWQEENLEKKTFLPEGIVIPSYVQNQLVKIKIRRNKWHPNDSCPKYVEISGSSPAPSIFGSSQNLPAIILESELDAMLVQQEAENLCLSIALGGATKKPDDILDSLLLKSPLILFSLDYDESGIMAFKWWKNQYKHLIIWVSPFEKSIGDAFKNGLDIKSWIHLGIQQYESFKK
jgi:hypothetical protein